MRTTYLTLSYEVTMDSYYDRTALQREPSYIKINREPNNIYIRLDIPWTEKAHDLCLINRKQFVNILNKFQLDSHHSKFYILCTIFTISFYWQLRVRGCTFAIIVIYDLIYQKSFVISKIFLRFLLVFCICQGKWYLIAWLPP